MMRNDMKARRGLALAAMLLAVASVMGAGPAPDGTHAGSHTVGQHTTRQMSSVIFASCY